MRKYRNCFGRLMLPVLIMAVLCCGEKNMKEIDRLEGDYNRYIVLMLTNRSYQEIEAFLPEMKFMLLTAEKRILLHRPFGAR